MISCQQANTFYVVLDSYIFILMCLVHVNLLSKYSPRYLNSVTLGKIKSYTLTVGQFPFLVVNVICIDFVSLAFMRHLSSHV